ncbi:hypothetical protein J6590_049718 [Homalodisca vitripennis]|nr:hypothetical protein J6590_049718 [Homalodisca vitripennis]
MDEMVWVQIVVERQESNAPHSEAQIQEMFSLMMSDSRAPGMRTPAIEVDESHGVTGVVDASDNSQQKITANITQ